MAKKRLRNAVSDGGIVLPEWVIDTQIRLKIEAIVNDANNTNRQQVLDIISAANAVIKDQRQTEKKKKEAKISARTALTAIIVGTEIHVNYMNQVEIVAAFKVVRNFKQIQKAGATKSPILTPSAHIREQTPAGTEIPKGASTKHAQPQPLLPRKRPAILSVAATFLVLATLLPRNRSQRTSLVIPNDGGITTDVVDAHLRTDISIAQVPELVVEDHTPVESVETPVVYNWKFARPKPPGYQNACIQGAVMSVLIGEFAMPMNNLYTNAVAHRAEVALKAARSHDIHTQENTDYIAISYHPDRGVIVVAQMRIGNSQPLGLAIVNLRDQTNPLPFGLNIEAAGASVSNAWLQYSH